MKKILFTLLLFSFYGITFAQNFKGRVLDKNQQPVEAVSIFIKEIKQGLACNVSGYFQTTLSPGKYTCEFSCLGYEKMEKQIVIRPQEVTEIEVIMTTKEFNLKEVEITRTKEDPANRIIREAIKKAPYYQNLIKEYRSETYIKGSGKAIHIPALFEKMAGDDIQVYKDKLFLQESFKEVHFTAPDQYEQTVKAFSTSMPNNFDPKESFGVFTSSLYKPKFIGFISPLNPKAFNYYKFQYDGCEDVNGQLVYKIKIIRKLQSPQLIEGYLYIADEEWNIRDAELTAYPTGLTIDYRINYNQVAPTAYLPTSYQMDLNADIMGLKFKFNYLSSAKYLSIQLNDSLIAGNQATKKSTSLAQKKSLEIKDSDNHKIEADSLATKRDSAFWNKIRTVSLNEEEIKSYNRKDTVQAKADSLKQKRLHPKFKWTDPLYGGRIGGDSSRLSFKYDGLIAGFTQEYNFVDGLWMGQRMELNYRYDSSRLFRLIPSVYWTSARKNLSWNTKLEMQYAPLKLGTLSLSAGSVSTDYMGQSGASRIVNSIYSLTAGTNLSRLYLKNFININNEIDVANGLKLRTLIELADRKTLTNHTTFSFFGKNNSKPNIPEYPGDLNSEYNRLARYGIGINYTPMYYYRISKGKKYYDHSSYPTFSLFFQQGVPLYSSGNSTFAKINTSISQTIKTGLFDALSYKIGGGMFLNHNEFNYIDYNHFNTENQFLSVKPVFQAYSLLDYYTYSTNKQWLDCSLGYYSQYLLIKRLPFMQRKIITESLSGKFLTTPGKPAYSEWGYSIGLPGLFTANVSVAFDKTKFNAWGISLSIPLLNETLGSK